MHTSYNNINIPTQTTGKLTTITHTHTEDTFAVFSENAHEIVYILQEINYPPAPL